MIQKLNFIHTEYTEIIKIKFLNSTIKKMKFYKFENLSNAINEKFINIVKLIIDEFYETNPNADAPLCAGCITKEQTPQSTF
jgi:hypothetical protein